MYVSQKNTFCIFIFFSCLISSCSVQKKIARSAKTVLGNASLSTAHVGISIYEPSSGKYWYNYQGDHYFVPASNTKIPTCYAAMKYLGDSLTSLRYVENDTALYIIATGDPTLLHPDFKNQPAIRFLKNSPKPIYALADNWKEEALGNGWSWNDYNDDYMAERSPLPVYGNVIKWIQSKDTSELAGINGQSVISVFSEPDISWPVDFNTGVTDSSFFVRRKLAANMYTIYEGKETYKEQQVPFVTNGILSSLELLKDTVGKNISVKKNVPASQVFQIIHSQPIDSLLTPMMHRSDNFFAEQSLLMVSNQLAGYMNDEKIIDSLLTTDFSDLPQKPRWVDGSGLSRYNLFSPQDFVIILNKLKNEFGMKRIQTIFPTGGTGTLNNYYKDEAGFIFAKTGTLSGVVSLSGYLYTKKNKLLVFSILVNNHRGSATDIRRVVEGFLRGVRNNN